MNSQNNGTCMAPTSRLGAIRGRYQLKLGRASPTYPLQLSLAKCPRGRRWARRWAGGVYVHYSVVTVIALTQYIEVGTRGGAARPRWPVNVGWEKWYDPSLRYRGGSLQLGLAMRGGVSGQKALHIHLIYPNRSITKSSP